MSKAEANLIGLQNNSFCLLQINFTFRCIGETPTAVNKNYAHSALFITNPTAHSVSAWLKKGGVFRQQAFLTLCLNCLRFSRRISLSASLKYLIYAIHLHSIPN